MNKGYDTAKIKVENPFELIYEGQVSTDSALNPSINLLSAGISFEEIKALMDKTFNNCVEAVSNNDSTIKSYFYNSIYGNRYHIYYDTSPNRQQLILSINSYIDDKKESYLIENGELVRLDNADLTTDYHITKKNGKIEVAEKPVKPSKDWPVSEYAKQCWKRIKPLFSERELENIPYVVLESNGLKLSNPISQREISSAGVSFPGSSDVAIAEEYKNLPENVQKAIKSAMTRLKEGETTNWSEKVPGNRLYIDYIDLLDEKGNAFSDIDLLRSFAVMKGNYIFNNKNQKDTNAEYPENGTEFEKNTFRQSKNGYVYQFADQFYHEIYSTESYYKDDLYAKYPGEFICEDAARSIRSDMEYSFAEFVVRDKPTGESIIDRKIGFFYNYPEFIQIREELRKHL